MMKYTIQSVEKLKIKRGAIAPQKGFGDEGLQPLSPLLHFVQHLPAPRGVTRNLAPPPLGEGLGWGRIWGANPRKRLFLHADRDSESSP